MLFLTASTAVLGVKRNPKLAVQVLNSNQPCAKSEGVGHFDVTAIFQADGRTLTLGAASSMIWALACSLQEHLAALMELNCDRPKSAVRVRATSFYHEWSGRKESLRKRARIRGNQTIKSFVRHLLALSGISCSSPFAIGLMTHIPVIVHDAMSDNELGHG